MTKAEDLKQSVSTILTRALAGYTDDFKYKAKDGRVFVRWGEVEKAFHTEIDRVLND
jgi:hypothetical protein